jgi:cysteine-rich repeat protein
LAPTPTNTPQARCVEAAPNNPCVPGGGPKRTDCNLEFDLAATPQLSASGIPKRRATCYEGDPRCDSDPDLANDSCTFALRLCINDADPRFPSCAPSALRSLQVIRPNPKSSDPTDAANLATLEGQAGSGAGGFGLDVVRTDGLVEVGAANATANLCSEPLPLLVPLRESGGNGFSSGRRSFKLRVTTPAFETDTDTLVLICRPSTCGDGIVESDHEECDDGNRANGDGCNQACQIE